MRAIFVLMLLAQGSFSYVYQKENRYSGFLKQYQGIGEVSGLNLKITEESLDRLVDKVMDDLQHLGELDERLFDFKEDDSDMGDFEDVDLTFANDDDDSEEEEGSDSESEERSDSESKELTPFPSDGAVISTKFMKREYSYSRIYVLNNKKKSFLKVHESVGVKGSLNSTVKGSLASTLTIKSEGPATSYINTTVYAEGKEYKTKTVVNSKVKTSATDRKSAKGYRILSGATCNVKMNIAAGNRTGTVEITAKSGSETFIAPFRVYLTLFESKFELKTGADGDDFGDAKKIGGVVKGEVTSRVVFAKKGKSLTKTTLRGYVMSEGDQFCAVKMFKVWSHIWVKHATKVVTDADYKDNEVDDSIDLEVCTYSKGKVYGKMAAGKGKGTKVFSGSGVASFEKDKVTIPKAGGLKDYEYGVKYMVKSLLDRQIFKMQFMDAMS